MRVALASSPEGPLPGDHVDWRVAKFVGVTVGAVRRMPVWEYVGWLCMAIVQREAEERARRR